MVTLLATVHIVVCFALIGLVLVQDSKGGGVFTSQASSNSVLGAGGATTLAQTMTKVIAVLFAATCIGLTIMSASKEKSVIDTMTPAAAAAAAVPGQPAAAATTPPATSTEQNAAAKAPSATPPATNEKK